MVANIKNGPARQLTSFVGVDTNGKGGTATFNLNASTDPSASNDSTQFYQVGSLWQNSLTGRIWIARSVSVAAAVWSLMEFSNHPGYIAGNWYTPYGAGSTTTAGANPGIGSIRLFPGYIKERTTLSALGVRVSTLAAGGNVQAAIYANNPATGRPTGNALAATASLSTASVTNVNAAVSVQVEPGLYWFATCMDNVTSALQSVSAASLSMSALIGSATQGNDLAGNGMNGLSVSGTFGTWPSMTSASFTELVGSGAVGIVQFQIGSVP